MSKIFQILGITIMIAGAIIVIRSICSPGGFLNSSDEIIWTIKTIKSFSIGIIIAFIGLIVAELDRTENTS